MTAAAPAKRRSLLHRGKIGYTKLMFCFRDTWRGLDSKSVAYMAFNFVTAVGIVFANKFVFQDFHFHFATVMTALHFFATWGGVMANLRMGMYEVEELRHIDVLPISLSFCSFVVFNNLSLQHNSVGFYQLMKVLTTPVVVVLQEVMYSKVLPPKLKWTLVPICIGVGLATVNDFSFNMAGFMWASAGLIATAFYQLLVKTKQDQLQVNSFQLLHYQAPQSGLLVALCSPLFDNIKGRAGLLQYHYTWGAMAAILLSCVLAYCVNLSTYLVIGHTSPVSYHVLGHFKLLVILSAGIFLFEEDSNPLRLLGMVLAFIGIVWYTTLKQSMANEWASKPEAKLPLVKEDNESIDHTEAVRLVEMPDARKAVVSVDMEQEPLCADVGVDKGDGEAGGKKE